MNIGELSPLGEILCISEIRDNEYFLNIMDRTMRTSENRRISQHPYYTTFSSLGPAERRIPMNDCEIIGEIIEVEWSEAEIKTPSSILRGRIVELTNQC